MWWLIVIGILIYVIYQVNKDHKEHVETHISNFGGMKVKYKIVIDYLVNEAGLNITKITKESVILSTQSSQWTLDYVGTNLEVRMRCMVPLLGNVKKKWIFPSSYPQEKMIEEFKNYGDWLMEQFKNAVESNPYQYLDDND